MGQRKANPGCNTFGLVFWFLVLIKYPLLVWVFRRFWGLPNPFTRIPFLVQGSGFGRRELRGEKGGRTVLSTTTLGYSLCLGPCSFCFLALGKTRVGGFWKRLGNGVGVCVCVGWSSLAIPRSGSSCFCASSLCILFVPSSIYLFKRTIVIASRRMFVPSAFRFIRDIWLSAQLQVSNPS